MANTNPPVRGQAWTVRIGLEDFATPGRLKASATIASGDFKVDTDGAGFGNPTTLPSVSPAAGKAVLVTLSTTEMDGDLITLVWSDQTDPPEWADGLICIQTTT